MRCSRYYFLNSDCICYPLRWRSTGWLAATCLCFGLKSFAVCEAQGSHFEQGRFRHQDEPGGMDAMLDRILWATDIARRVASTQDPEIPREEAFQSLQILHDIVGVDCMQWREDGQFRTATELLLVEMLAAKLGNFETMPVVFEAASFLPKSKAVSGIILEAFRQGGSSGSVWNRRLYEKVHEDDITAIQLKLRSDDVETVAAWELDILGAEGSPASNLALQNFSERVRHAESTFGRRLRGVLQSRDIEFLVALGPARSDPRSLLRWGMEASRFGVTARGLWAFDEVLHHEGPNAAMWDDVWADLEVRAYAYAKDYLERAKAYVANPGARASPGAESLLVDNWLTPWVDWADRGRVAVPDRIRSLTLAAPPFPVPD